MNKDSKRLTNSLYKMLVEVMIIELNYIYQEYRNDVVIGHGINIVGLDSVLKWAGEKHDETGVVLLSDLVVKRLKDVFGDRKINDIIDIICLDYRHTYDGNIRDFVYDKLGGNFVEKVIYFGRNPDFYDGLRNRDLYDGFIGDYLDRIEVLKKRYF